MSNPSQVLYGKISEKIINLHCSQQQIDNLKSRYANEINSPRRLDCVLTLRDLVQILEHRDVLNLDNIEVFEEIATHFNDKVVLGLIKQYNTPNVPCLDEYHRTIEVVPQFVKRKVYDTIARELGLKWVDFARALDVREGEIDDLRARVIRLSDCVYEVLYMHEENCDKRMWKTELLRALVKARRRDLMLRVERIFDINNVD